MPFAPMHAPRPPASAGGRRLLAALAASPAPSGGLPPRPAARRGAARRGLDRRLRMREAEDAGVARCTGLGTADWGKLGGRRYWHRTDHGSRLLARSYATLHAQRQPIASRVSWLP